MQVTPWSFEEFSRSVAGPGNRRFAMLVAYFDESGTHGEASEVVTVAGLVGDSVAWSRLELPWNQRLANDEIACFHASPCEAGEGEYRLIPRDRRSALSNDLAKLTASRGSDLCAVGMSVYRDDWSYGASDSVKRQCRTMYHFCLLMVLLQVNQLSKDRAGGSPVAFVFANQPQYKEYTTAIHEVFQQIARYSSIGHLGFGEPKCIVPLQAADQYAYETYRELVAQQKDAAERPAKRNQLRVIDDSIEVRSKVAGIEFLHASSEQIDKLEAKFSSMGRTIPPFA